MNIEEAVNFLVEHAAQVDAELATMRAEMATKAEVAEIKKELAEIKRDVRTGTQAMRHYNPAA